MEITVYKSLPPEAARIREEIFLGEQKFTVEFDEIDEFATHILLTDVGKTVGTCRFFFSKERRMYVIGRVAVVKEYRGQGCGAMLIAAAEKEISNLGGESIYISSQCRASKFYAKQGYKPHGEIYYDEYCPHIGMIKKL